MPTPLAVLGSARALACWLWYLAATNFIWRNRGISGQLVISVAMKARTGEGASVNSARRALPRTYEAIRCARSSPSVRKKIRGSSLFFESRPISQNRRRRTRSGGKAIDRGAPYRGCGTMRI